MTQGPGSGARSISASWRRPAQLRPGRAQAMISRQLVAAVAADQGDRAAADGAGQGREQVQRRVVCPLQIVEEHGEPAGPRHARQGRAHRRGQGRPAGLGRRRAKPRQHQRQLMPGPPAPGGLGRRAQGPPPRPRPGPMGWPLARGRQDLRQHLVHGRFPPGGPAAPDRLAGAGQHMIHERRLAHPGLARHQHDRRPPGRGAVEELLERLHLRLPADQHPARAHSLNRHRNPAPCRSPLRGEPANAGDGTGIQPEQTSRRSAMPSAPTRP